MSDTLQQVCDYFELGTLYAAADLHGGRSHTVYKVTTDQGDFVIKKLSASRDAVLDLDIFRNTAAISLVVEKSNFPAITPYIKHNDVLFKSENSAYMVCPFYDGHVIRRSNMSITQCKIVATFLANLHNLNLSVPAAMPWDYRYKSADWKNGYDYFVENHNYDIALLLERLTKMIRNCFSKYIEFKAEIACDVVVSHRDIDPYNILWQPSGAYAVIDWDLAGQIDAAEELMYAAIGFARESTTRFNFGKFTAMLECYVALRPIKTSDARPLFYAVLANWLTWSQGRLNRIVFGQHDLATLNQMIAGLRNSLLATEYLLSIEKEVLVSWHKICSHH